MHKQHYTSIEELPLTLNALDIANILGISRSQAYILLKTEGFPALHIGRRILVPKHSFIDWLNRRTGEIA